MSYPGLADMVVVQHFWWDEKTRDGVNGSVTFTPKTIGSTNNITPNLTDGAEKAWIKTRAWKVTPDGITGYLAVPLTPNDDPDLTAFGGYEVAPDGETSQTVAIPSTAGTTTVTTQMRDALAKLSPPVAVTVGASVKTVWLTDVATISSPPTPPDSFFDATATTAAIAAAVLAHDDDTSAHSDIRAVLATIPEQARDAVGAALVAGSGITVTVDDAANTITLTATGGGGGGITTEDAQDAMAALLAAGTQSGITFTYDDAGNTLSATVSAQAWSQITGKPTFSTVATSGAYTDLTGKPSIPAAYSDLTGTVPQAALPAVALTDYLTPAPASQAAMLALTGQRGDWTTRTDRGTDWQLIADDSTQLASWREMTYPASPVSSVNGRTGPVTGLAEASDVSTALAGKQAADTDLAALAALDATTAGAIASDGSGWIKKTYAQLKTALGLVKGDVGLGNVDNVADTAKPVSTAQQTALDAKAPLNIPVRAVSGNTTAVVGEFLKVDATGGTRTVAPPGSPAQGNQVVLTKTDSTTNPVAWSGTVQGDSQGAQLVTQWATATFVYDGSIWLIESSNIDHGGLSQAAADARYATPAYARAQALVFALAMGD